MNRSACDLPQGMHKLLRAKPERFFSVWRLRSFLMTSTPWSEFITQADLSQKASLAVRGLQALMSREDPWHCHVPLAQICPNLLYPLWGHHPGRNLPPLSRAAGLTRGQGRMLWGVSKFQPYLQRLRSWVENVSVFSASFLLAPLFVSTKPPLCEQFWSPRTMFTGTD